MKEPTEHHVYDDGHDDDAGECTADGQEWPCKTWRRWTKSKDYRIAELEATVKRLSERTTAQAGTLIDLQKTVRDDSNILRNGVFRAMQDVGRHGRMGNLTLDWQRDVQDFTMAGSSHIARIAGSSELTVIYEDLGGRTWTNGEITEQTLPPGG